MSFRRRPQRNSNGGRPHTSRFGGNRNRRSVKKLDISSFISHAKTQEPVKAIEIKHQFTDFDLMQRMRENIRSLGFTVPTPIQDQAISEILAGKDVLGIANTGTGKTGAFLIPLIQKIAQDRSQMALIMAPTRELALQIEAEFQKFNQGMGLRSVLCIGGTSMYRQESQLRRRYNIVVGTPGRLKDLASRHLISMDRMKLVVLDEVDRMLDMGFIRDIRTLMESLPKERQSLFFSATMTNEISKLISDFSRDLVRVSVKQVDTAATVQQDIVKYTTNSDKMETLHKLLISEGFDKVIIFGRTKHGVNRLSRELDSRGFRTDAIHGNKSQPQRQRALMNFKSNRVNILVATDVAARGLDIDNVSHVINFDIPETYDDYVHRIGRTGRAEKTGQALTFVQTN